MIISLRIRFVGLSLWVARDDHADVLFPIHGEGNELHVTTLFDGDAQQGEKGLSLAGKILDLTGLDVVDRRRRPLQSPGLLEIRASADAPVSDPTVINDGRYVAAALQLPYGTLSPLEMPLEGPFTYEGREDVYIGHGLVWSTPVRVEAGAPVQGEMRMLADNGSRSKLELGVPDADSRRLDLAVSCESDADRMDKTGGLKYGDHIADFRAHWPLVNSTPISPMFGGGTQHRTASIFSKVETVHKLCPSVTAILT